MKMDRHRLGLGPHGTEVASKVIFSHIGLQLMDDYPAFHLLMDCFWAQVVSGDLVLKEAEAAKCLTPKPGFEEYEPLIEIYDTSTNFFYDIALEGDPFSTECIMDRIQEVIEIADGNDAIFYTVFSLLHEVGHLSDYKKDPKKYQYDFSDADSGEQTMEAAIEYRNRPLEKIADEFALEHMEEAIGEVKSIFFAGCCTGSALNISDRAYFNYALK